MIELKFLGELLLSIAFWLSFATFWLNLCMNINFMHLNLSNGFNMCTVDVLVVIFEDGCCSSIYRVRKELGKYEGNI